MSTARRGFTLIEVVGALVMFSVGVLLAIQISGALSAQLEHAAVSAEVVTRGQKLVDSILAEPYGQVSTGVWGDTLTVRNRSYTRTVAVVQFSPLLRRLTVTLEPSAGGSGPSFSATTFSADSWKANP